MKEGTKTKPLLSGEMKNLRQRIRGLEDSENKRKEAEEALRKSESSSAMAAGEAIERLQGEV
jgi:hypothetical protein